MPEASRIFDKLEAISVEQGRQAEALDRIDAHLAKLNGSVAKQWEEIGTLKTKDAVREGKEKGERGVISAASPALWVVLWVVAVLALLNAKSLLALVK